MSHRTPQTLDNACRHALRKAHDSPNETHNRVICINDALSDSEYTAPPCEGLILRSLLRPRLPLLPSLHSSRSSLVLYRFYTITPLVVDMVRDHVRRLLISLVNQFAWKNICCLSDSPTRDLSTAFYIKFDNTLVEALLILSLVYHNLSRGSTI